MGVEKGELPHGWAQDSVTGRTEADLGRGDRSKSNVGARVGQQRRGSACRFRTTRSKVSA